MSLDLEDQGLPGPMVYNLAMPEKQRSIGSVAGNDTTSRSRQPINGKEPIMYTVVRHYSGQGASALFDVLEEHKVEVESMMRAVKGLVSYTLARSEDGGFSVTVCQDKAGTDESVRVAREWIAKNAGNTGVGAPKVSEGSVIVQAK
ncbi:MAG: hypothetical protein JWQ03_1066 [Variovorax sp.]|nr:hypothetical protein [Variovorax sp.]